MRYTPVVLIAVAVLLWPHTSFAQQDAADAGSARVDVQALAGLTTDVADPHGAAGGMVRVHLAGWGLLGLGAYGAGGQYTSRLYGGALSREIGGLGPATFSAFAGYGRYGEVGWTGIERSGGGALFGAIAAFDLEPLVLSVTVSDLYGSYDEPDVTEPFSFHVPRLLFGVGL